MNQRNINISLVQILFNKRQNISQEGGQIMPRKGENIYKRKDGRWEGRYIKNRSDDGKAIYGYVYARTYLDVKNKLISARMNCIPQAGLQAQESTMMFGDLACMWMNMEKPRVKESTYMKYRNTLANYILPKYRNVEISKISSADLETYISDLLCSGGTNNAGLSAKTVNDTITIIRSIFRFATRNGLSVVCSTDDMYIKQTSKELSVFSLKEQEILQNYLILHHDNIHLGILICLLTGIRIGELSALRWEDISFSDKTLYVHQTLQRVQCDSNNKDLNKTCIIISTPKSDCSIRKIPIPDFLIEHMTKYYTNQNGYLLTAHEKKFIEPRTMQNHYKRILRECDIPYKNCHSLRHTFATRCVELGFDIKSLSEILGHANVNITMNRYVHPTMELKRRNMNLFSDLFTVK